MWLARIGAADESAGFQAPEHSLLGLVWKPGVHLRVANRDQRLHPQAAVSLDADHYIVRLVGILPRSSCSTPIRPALPAVACSQPCPGHVHHVHVVMGFSPVVIDKDHRPASSKSESGVGGRPDVSVGGRADVSDGSGGRA
jgi:hypothetical protein